jgi:hypothetical protein
MAARACSFMAAMMDDDDGAVEGVPDCIGGLHIGSHVAIVAFGPGKGAVQGVDGNCGRFDIAERGADRRD